LPLGGEFFRGLIVSQPVVSREAVQRFYDRLGRRLDWGDRFESLAKQRTMVLLRLGPGQRVLNVGAGTGKDHLNLQSAVQPGGFAVGVDISPVMLRLASARGAHVVRADMRRLPFSGQSFDRLFCTYVLDLIPDSDLPAVLAEFQRVLKPGGRMGLASMTEGATLPSRIVIAVWNSIYGVAPNVTGGCRPLALAEVAAKAGLRVVAREIVVQCAFPSEVVAAVRE
jgi:demethylmenaquinone methyltransferase/2-methoxy-6-polyprenyl-1,4-benzoquinol methylase